MTEDSNADPDATWAMTPPVVSSPLTAPSYKLYTPSAIGLATFLGSPLAGFFLMSTNFRRLGLKPQATNAVIYGIITTVILIGIAMVLPDRTPPVIAIASIFVVVQLAKSQQGAMIDAHRAAGGKMASNSLAAGIGLISLVAVLAVLFGIVMLMPDEKGIRIEFGKDQEIFYSGASTEADARKLGNLLRKSEFFLDDGQPRSVLLSKDGSVVKLSFVTSETTWHDPKYQNIFRDIASKAGNAGLGAPIDLHFIDPNLESKWETRVE